ncbi:MAG: TusE/DsrC/DsvC family sulfur relay protein [Gammaproteobacteria bacterium]|nr:MAG: TusE/DsrC/DsvC family sulfur relay protein [Gammaproteobacteria bacterium]
MAIEVDGKTIEISEKGYLVNLEDWNEKVAEALAAAESVELTEKHWDIVSYLRNEYLNNNQNQPNERSIVKAMKGKWGNASSKDMYDLFPQMPSKQGGKIAGLPESRRKGGY